MPELRSSPTAILPIEYKTDWGLFQLVKAGAGQSSSSPYTLTFDRGGKKITVIIKSGGGLFDKNFDAFKSVKSMPQAILK